MYGTGAPVGIVVAAGGAVLTATNAPMMVAATVGVGAIVGALFWLRVVRVRRARGAHRAHRAHRADG